MLFRILCERRFENASSAIGPEFNGPIVDGSAAYAYYEHVRLIGTKSNRSPIGAVVRIESASGKRRNMLCSGSSYCPRRDPGADL